MKIQEQIDLKLQVVQDERKDRKRSGKFSPSSMGRCYRLQYWNRQAEKPSNPIDARTLRVFEVGKIFHEFIQDIILEENPLAQTEVLIQTDDVIGFADIVLPDEVIELKSMHSRGFHYLKDATIREQKFQNILQAMVYAVILGKHFVRMVFISKDDLCIAEYKIKVTDEWRKDVKDEMTMLMKYWNKQELPPPEPRAYNGKDCNYCGYKDKCKQLEKGE